MSQDVSAIIRALLAKTAQNGATEAEVMAAAEKARDLMDRHRLTMTDLEIQEEAAILEKVDRAAALKTTPADLCLSGIEVYCGVKTWFKSMWKVEVEPRRVRRTRQLQILGLKDDVAFARYFYEMIGTVIAEQTKVFQTAEPYRESWDRRCDVRSFQIGMAKRIDQRLVETARELEPVAKTAPGTALVVVRNALIGDAFTKLGFG